MSKTSQRKFSALQVGFRKGRNAVKRAIRDNLNLVWFRIRPKGVRGLVRLGWIAGANQAVSQHKRGILR